MSVLASVGFRSGKTENSVSMATEFNHAMKEFSIVFYKYGLHSVS